MTLFDKTFSRSQKALNYFKRKPIYALKIASTRNILADFGSQISVEDFTKWTSIDPVKFYSEIEKPANDQQLETLLNILLSYMGGNKAGEQGGRTYFLSLLADAMSYPYCPWKDGAIFISSVKDESLTIEEFSAFSKVFKNHFGEDLVLEKVSPDVFDAVLQKRYEETRNYYVDERGEWTMGFIDMLGDEVSKESFRTFIRQRISATVLLNFKNAYPISPPPLTAPWREMRRNIKFDFPELKGSPTPQMLEFFNLHTFIYEQYAIPGVVEALPGNIVIDAGAFIGDTACYFSRKIGKQGKVYAFEATPETLQFGRENMLRNGCDNVEFVPYALSDRKKNLVLNSMPCSSQGNYLSAEEANSPLQTTIPAISLDEYCDEHGIHFDFLKADIEGGEMDMLRGAKNTIARDAPVCAIALYHRQEDYWQIPQYLTELCGDYKFWFRCEAEPVLFARRG